MYGANYVKKCTVCSAFIGMYIQQVVNATIETDIPQYADLTVSTARKLKRLLAIIAQSAPFKPNMSQIGGQLEVSRNKIADLCAYLEKAGLIGQLRTSTGGIQGLGKVDKIYLDNPTLIYTLAGRSVEIGTVRETFFFNQTRSLMSVTVSPISDFLIDGKYTFEVGGKKKRQKKLQNIEHGYVVKDVAARETDVRDITHYMVGREVAAGGAAHDIRDHSDARTILSIRKLWVDMPGEIVRNVDLDVKEGEILGIGGLAGQGKLGIPNGVMGLYEAGGTVEFDGKPIALNSPRKCLDSQLAFVSEDRRGVGLLLDESLEWNVAFPAMQVQDKFLKRMGFFTWRDEKAIHTVTNRYIDELQIKCTGSSQKARELSGGNQQKVCLAKAFALEPRFLFVSEPTRGIDVGAKALVLEALKKFNRESGVTVVMISSELEELRQICDRIAIVSGGRVAGILPADHSSEEFGMLMVSQVK